MANWGGRPRPAANRRSPLWRIGRAGAAEAIYSDRVKDAAGKRVRLDKWLWAARFYKTRSKSTEAIKNGRIELDGQRAKPSHRVGVGTSLAVRKGAYRFEIDVRALAERRGSAEAAAALYEERAASAARREETRQRLAAERAHLPPESARSGRPTKRDRRQLMAFRERLQSPEDLDDEVFNDYFDVPPT